MNTTKAAADYSGWERMIYKDVPAVLQEYWQRTGGQPPFHCQMQGGDTLSQQDLSPEGRKEAAERARARIENAGNEAEEE